MTTTEHVEPAATRPGGWVPADSFAARLMLARLHLGNITIREAAARCGLNYATWSNWERGMEPRGLLVVVGKISQGLGVDRNWLLFGGPLADESSSEGTAITRRYPWLPRLTSGRSRLRPRGRGDVTRPSDLFSSAA